MSDRIDNVLAKFATKNFSVIEDILKHLETDTSKIIELIGHVGIGKSHIFQKLINTQEIQGYEFKPYIPSTFKFNQLYDILTHISSISDEQFDSILKEAKQHKISSKYDFFYFLSEKLDREKLLNPSILVIYEDCYLDDYTTDFLEYLTQYSTHIPIRFVVFTRAETYIFSHKIWLKTPSVDDIKSFLNMLYPDSKADFQVEAEIIKNISDGNLVVLEYILDQLIAQETKPELSSFMDKQIDQERVYVEKINSLTKRQQELLFTIYLLDTKAEKQILKEIFKQSLDKLLDVLLKQKVVFLIGEHYLIRSVYFIEKIYKKLPDEKKQTIYSKVKKHLSDLEKMQYDYYLDNYSPDELETVIERLTKINDFDSLYAIYSKLDSKALTEEKRAINLKQMGLVCIEKNNNEQAIEFLREALKIYVKQSMPAEEVVYHLAKSLFSINSSAFALEVIKKYSPKEIDTYWHCKIVLLKAEILLDNEDFNETAVALDTVYRYAVKLENKFDRYTIQAESKKLKGKIHYFKNDLSKAQLEFEDAEELFSEVNNVEGMAAIYNNLGVLMMVQGDWKKTETLFLKSLKYEKKRYNLKGISVCYINLGSLFEDKSNYKKALYYLNEALKIQKMLGDRYNIINTYLNIGVTYMDNGKYKDAEQAFKESLNIAATFNLYRHHIATLNNLGALYFKSGDFSKAIDYYERAVERSRENKFHEGSFQSYNNLGELFEILGDYNQANEYYNKALELIPNINDEYMKSELYGNLGSVLTHLHKFGEAYGFLVESLDFFKKMNAKAKIIEGYHKNAYYFYMTRNLESANYCLNAALQIAEELNHEYLIGKTYYLMALVEKAEPEQALKLLKQAIEYFVKTNNNYDLALANYEYAQLLLEQDEWEQALQILKDNSKIIERYGAIKLLEQNDYLIQKINKKYAVELKESKQQENLLNKFYEVTQSLNMINDFDLLLQSAIDKIVEFSDADGGVFCLHYNEQVKDNWEYIVLNNFSTAHEDFSKMMKIVHKTSHENKNQNIKQPSFAPEYNNIVAFPLTVRNEQKGVICLFTKHGVHYFTERMFNLLSALCNQVIMIVENISHSILEKAHAVIREELAAGSSFSNIIGTSNKIQEIFRLIEKIKDTPTTILLEGPSGTGKELIARAIHYNSNRRNKKFVAQYCGALPETLLESELFGHAKGAFTGATHDKKGLFEIADGGTFFLDEIADISLSTQAKLLRFLQEGEIKRVGAVNTQKVDVRVICATNTSLKDTVEKGEFRLDLFYRLNVIKIEIPSLRERKTDIPLLAIHFLDKYSKKIDKKVKGITDEAMRYLENYDWPGNIRQLENEIERAVTLAEENSLIRSSDLSEEIFKHKDNIETINLLEEKNLKQAVEKMEYEMILNALNNSDWNQTKAAKMLGLSRQGLIKKMQRYNLQRQ